MSTNEAETTPVEEPTSDADAPENIFDMFGTDEKAETEGLELNYGAAGWLLCARAGGANKRYKKRMEHYYRKHKRRIDLDMITEEQAREDLYKIFAETVVLDGELRGKDGTMVSLKGKPAKTIELFRILPGLFDDVRDQVGKPTLFKESLREEEAKN